jgi:hypothetical protein
MLVLNETDVTDEGLMHLANSKKLTYLSVSDKKVTRAGAMRLQAELPNCDIEPFSPRDAAWLQVLNAKGQAFRQSIQDDVKRTNAYVQKLTGGTAGSK